MPVLKLPSFIIETIGIIVPILIVSIMIAKMN